MSMVVDRRGELSDREVDALAERIRAVETRHDVRAAVEVGRMLLEDVFDGDVDAVGSPDRTKATSLRRVAAALQRPVSRLSTAIRIAVQYESFPADLRDRLSASHHEVLLGAPEMERIRIGRQAAEAGLTVRQLQGLIADGEIPPPAEPLDRSPIAVIERSLAPLRDRILRAVDEDPSMAEVYADRLGRTIDELQKLRRSLRRR